MATNDVTIRLNAQDKASPSINQVKQSLTGLVSAQGIVGGVVGGLIGGGMMGLANAAIQAAAAIPQAVGELANMAMQAERTESAFVNLSGSIGESSTAMLASLKELTGGTISDTELMLSANRAMMLGVSDNAEEMGQLMAAAIERGRALGVSSQQAVNDIITGIGRMSPMILDNLGIVGVTQSVEEYARSLGKTSDALTDVEKKQALVNAVIASGSGQPVLDDAASSFERMDASIKNLQVSLGELFGPAIAAVAQSMADAADVVTDAFDEEGIAATRAQWADVNAELSEVRNRAQELESLLRDIEGIEPAWLPPDKQQFSTDDIKAQIAALREQEAALQASSAAARIAAIEAQNLSNVTAQTETEFLNATWSSFGFKAALDTVGGAAVAAASQVEIFNAALSRMQPVLASVANIRQAAIGRIESLGLQAVQQGADPSEVTAMVGEATDAIWNMGLSYDATTEAQFANRLAVEAQLDPLSQLNEKLREADKASSSLAKNGLSEAEKAFNDLRSRVESMLSGSLSPDVSIPERLIPRGDDINENARRLAAIANEGIGDQSWMEEFKNEVPGIFDEIVNAANPQAAAARIFTEFQAGLRPELIDKDLVKKRITDMITGEREMSALATEIAQELAAEMGVSLPQAMAAAQEALGVPATGADGAAGGGTVTGVTIKPTFDLADVRSAGASAGAEFAAGMDAPGVANKFSVAFMLGMKEFYGRFYASGAASAGEYNSGFLTQFKSSVPVEIVLALATLVTPEVLAAIDARNGRSGALP